MTGADVFTRMLHAIDARDWTTLRASFADEVTTDYTSLWGGEPITGPADELIAGWREFMLGLDATQHITGPIATSDGHLRTHVVAYHWLGDDVWTVHGHYIVTVVDDKITKLTLLTFRQEGDRDLPSRARGATSR